MGQRSVSLKGNKSTWSGVSRLSTNDRGRRRFTTLDNCYVSQDGEEIRAFPGYATFLDLTDVNNSAGFGRYAPDAIRPILEYDTPNDPYRYVAKYSTPTSQSMECRAKITHPFAFEQVGNEIVLIGESRFRESPIHDGTRAKLTIASVDVVAGKWEVTLSAAPDQHSSTDAGAGLNGLTADAIIYIDEIDLPSSVSEADAALIQGDLVGRIHECDTPVAVGGTYTSATIPLTTTASGTLASAVSVTTGDFHQIRPNRGHSYPTPAGEQNTPYVDTYYNRPDDADALTSWRVVDSIDLSDSTKCGVYDCFPAWVANRQRDFGDGRQAASVVADTEGIYDASFSYRGFSRREQRRLPFRPNVETALDRIILAAPQYGCMFQIPMKVPIDASNWQAGGTSDTGLVFPNNNIYDKPRALGIPKPRLIESLEITPAQPSPGDYGTNSQYDSSISAKAGDQTLGLDSGEYQVAISFEDAGTGDEGLASEPISVVIPVPSGYAYTLRLNYIHPGYHFPESLCLRMNVYIAPPNQTALAFYGQFELAEAPIDGSLTDPQADVSGVYGVLPATEDKVNALIRSFDLPLLDNTGDLSGSLDATRLAPQSASMPRGANACKFIRGVLFSGGAMGNAGPNEQLWRAKATAQWYGESAFVPEDELNIRPHSIVDASFPSSDPQDRDNDETTLGIAGGAFPDAYQGIDFVSDELFPGGDSFKKVDRVLNRKTTGLYPLHSPSAGGFFRMHHIERLRLERDAFDRSRIAGTSPGLAAPIQEVEKPIYYVMPRGQMQIGDPGAPNRSSRAFIKVIDPGRGDDIQAFGHLHGSVIVCSRKETYTYSWYRNPAGDEVNLLTNEYGCIASNSMVEFDGGLAWLSERGPVALGQGLQHVGADVAEDFSDQGNRYMTDSRGMMRHSWGVHDAQRGLVMWGLLRRDSSQAPRSLTITYEGTDYTTASATLSDKVLSRFPCDEVLIWSYRANAFSHWRPPAGLEVYWMRPLRDADGRVRMCFLAADNRIYALDDAWSDRNAVANGGLGADSVLGATAVGNGTATTTLTLSATTHKDGNTSDSLKRNFSLLLAPGMVVEFLDADRNVTAVTTIDSVTSSDQSGGEAVIELSAAQTWLKGASLRIGARQTMKIVSTFIGQETMDTMDVEKIQMRYSTEGSGFANAKVKAFCNEFGTLDGEQAKAVDFTTDGLWQPLGAPKANTSIPAEITKLGRRINFARGRLSAPEIAVQVEISGEAQVRIQDLSLEVG